MNHYTRNPDTIRPVQFRLEADAHTLERSKLMLFLVSLESGATLAEMAVDDLN